LQPGRSQWPARGGRLSGYTRDIHELLHSSPRGGRALSSAPGRRTRGDGRGDYDSARAGERGALGHARRGGRRARRPRHADRLVVVGGGGEGVADLFRNSQLPTPQGSSITAPAPQLARLAELVVGRW